MENKIPRRKALKRILAAGWSFTAAAFLPVSWVKPEVSGGILPIHARSSGKPAGVPFSVSGSPFGNPNSYQCCQFISPSSITKAMLVGIKKVTISFTGGDPAPSGTNLVLAFGLLGPYAINPIPVSGSGPYISTDTQAWAGDPSFNAFIGLMVSLSSPWKADDGSTPISLNFE